MVDRRSASTGHPVLHGSPHHHRSHRAFRSPLQLAWSGDTDALRIRGRVAGSIDLPRPARPSDNQPGIATDRPRHRGSRDRPWSRQSENVHHHHASSVETGSRLGGLDGRSVHDQRLWSGVIAALRHLHPCDIHVVCRSARPSSGCLSIADADGSCSRDPPPRTQDSHQGRLPNDIHSAATKVSAHRREGLGGIPGFSQ